LDLQIACGGLHVILFFVLLIAIVGQFKKLEILYPFFGEK
jgi:hypothetical protein